MHPLLEKLELYLADNLEAHTIGNLMQQGQFKQHKRIHIRWALMCLEQRGLVESVISHSNIGIRRYYAHVGANWE